MVEVTLALGIVAATVVSTLGILAVGLEMNRDSVAATEAASVAREVAADLQMLEDWSEPSPRFRITPEFDGETPTTLYVNGDGTYLNAESASSEDRVNSAYRVDVSFGDGGGTRQPVAHIVVSWPTGVAGSGTWPSAQSSAYELVAGATAPPAASFASN